jgi:hypothetical protein
MEMGRARQCMRARLFGVGVRYGMVMANVLAIFEQYAAIAIVAC